MANDPTRFVFVVGAGASCEFGLPSGEGLKSAISYELNFQRAGDDARPFSHNEVLFKAFETLSIDGLRNRNTRNQFIEQCEKIKVGLPHAVSIDNFLHLHRNNELLVKCGKLGIAAAILRAEQKSTLAVTYNGVSVIRSNMKRDLSISSSWLAALFQLLSTGRAFREFCSALNHISFVCFNYDRCIENYFITASRELFPDEEFDSDMLSSSLKVINPYGNLGAIKSISDCIEKFGNIGSTNELIHSAKLIQTFTESVEDNDLEASIDSALSGADVLMFLGYGFIELNNKKLRNGKVRFIANVLATAFEEPSAGLDEVTQFVNLSFRRKPDPYSDKFNEYSSAQIENLKCGELFQHYRRRLSRLAT